jgi:hypothetical protein
MRLLSIFLAHSYYRSFSASGENVVFKAEAELLPSKGRLARRISVSGFCKAERSRCLNNLWRICSRE